MNTRAVHTRSRIISIPLYYLDLAFFLRLYSKQDTSASREISVSAVPRYKPWGIYRSSTVCSPDESSTADSTPSAGFSSVFSPSTSTCHALS